MITCLDSDPQYIRILLYLMSYCLTSQTQDMIYNPMVKLYTLVLSLTQICSHLVIALYIPYNNSLLNVIQGTLKVLSDV